MSIWQTQLFKLKPESSVEDLTTFLGDLTAVSSVPVLKLFVFGQPMHTHSAKGYNLGVALRVETLEDLSTLEASEEYGKVLKWSGVVFEPAISKITLQGGRNNDTHKPGNVYHMVFFHLIPTNPPEECASLISDLRAFIPITPGLHTLLIEPPALPDTVDHHDLALFSHFETVDALNGYIYQQPHYDVIAKYAGKVYEFAITWIMFEGHTDLTSFSVEDFKDFLGRPIDPLPTWG